MPSVYVNYKIIGLNVNTHRKRLNWTQDQLAERAGISKQFVSNIERGKTIPSLLTVLSLCDALDVTPNDLLHHSSRHNPDAPCTLRDDHTIFHETLSNLLFPQEIQEIRIDPQDLPPFDITLDDLGETE